MQIKMNRPLATVGVLVLLLAPGCTTFRRERCLPPGWVSASTERQAAPEAATGAPAGSAAAATAAPAAAATAAIVDSAPGDGPEAQPGDEVEYRYVCRLADGTLVFDSDAADGKTRKRFAGGSAKPVGVGTALVGARAGMVRTVTVPPEQAYGKEGNARSRIPPDATLVFELRIVAVHGARKR